MRWLSFILFFLMPMAWGQSALYLDCEQKLQRELARILKEDKHGLIALQFHVTVLRTAQKIIQENQKRVPAFDTYLHQHVAKLSQLQAQQPETLSTINQLYSEHATESMGELAKHINDLKSHPKPDGKIQNRYTNQDVASAMLLDRLTLKEQSVFSESDLAIVWYIKNVKNMVQHLSPYKEQKNLFELSIQVNRYLGIAGDTQVSKLQDIALELGEDQAELTKMLAQLKLDLRQALSECFDEKGLFQASCDLNMEETLADALLKLQPTVDELNQRTLKAVLSSAKKTDRPVATAAPKVTLSPSVQESGTMGCGPGFKSQEKNYVRLGVTLDTVKRWKTAMAALSGTIGKYGPCHIQKPVFFFEYERKNKSLCCDKAVSWKTDHFVSGGLEGGFRCDIPVIGAGPVASLGAFVGVNISAYPEGGFPASCGGRDKCLSVNLRVEPQGGVYGQAAANMVRIEGGVRASPKVQAEQCWANGAPKPFKVQYQWGALFVFWKVSFIGFDTSGIYKVTEGNEWRTMFERQLFTPAGGSW